MSVLFLEFIWPDIKKPCPPTQLFHDIMYTGSTLVKQKVVSEVWPWLAQSQFLEKNDVISA